MIFLSTYRNFNGVFFVKSKEAIKSKSPKTLGQLKEVLSSYEFPDSTAFLSLLQKFSETRNAIFHRLLTVTKEELDKGIVDKYFSDLRDLAEEILDKYNNITKGITKIWYSIAKPSLPSETLTKEQLEAQIDALVAQLSTLQAQLAEINKSEKK